MGNVIKVVKVINSSSLLSSVKGENLYQLIVDFLEKVDTVTLDFSDYEFLSTTFLNSSVGKLILENNWTKEKLFEIISIKGLSEDDMDRLRLSIQNALFKNELILKGQSIEDIYTANLSY